MKIKHVIKLLPLLLLGVANLTHATLISVNDSAFGVSSDGFNITRDTSTGLEWLDLSLTDAMLFDDVDASTITPAWRRATTQEVLGLYSSAGLLHPVSNQVIVDFNVNTGSPSTFTTENVTQAQFESLFYAAEDLMQMIGLTGGNNQGIFSSIGTTADFDQITSTASAVATLKITYSPFVSLPPGGCLGVLAQGCIPRSLEIYAPHVGSGIGDDIGRGDTGHFLVRNTVFGPTAVPEPGTFLLLLIPLSLLFFLRRGKAGIPAP